MYLFQLMIKLKIKLLVFKLVCEADWNHFNDDWDDNTVNNRYINTRDRDIFVWWLPGETWYLHGCCKVLTTQRLSVSVSGCCIWVMDGGEWKAVSVDQLIFGGAELRWGDQGWSQWRDTDQGPGQQCSAPVSHLHTTAVSGHWSGGGDVIAPALSRVSALKQWTRELGSQHSSLLSWWVACVHCAQGGWCVHAHHNAVDYQQPLCSSQPKIFCFDSSLWSSSPLWCDDKWPFVSSVISCVSSKDHPGDEIMKL